MKRLKLFITATTLQLAFIAALVVALCLPLAALAQVTGDPGPSLGDLLKQAMDVFTTWKTGGALVGIVALTNLLTNASKASIFDSTFNKVWWLRPTLSLVFGLVSGILTSVIGGVPVATAILTGLLSGLLSTAFHELVTQFNGRIVTERVVGSAVAKVAASGDAAKVTEMKTALDAAAAITDEKERLKALAAWANAHS